MLISFPFLLFSQESITTEKILLLLQTKDDKVKLDVLYKIENSEVYKKIVKCNQTKILPILIKNINNKNWKIRYGVIKALGILGDESHLTNSILIEKLKDIDPIKIIAIETLANFKKKSKEIVQALIDSLDENTEYVWISSIKALGKIDKQFIPILINELKQKPLKTKGKILLCLAQLGPLAKEFTPTIVDTIKRYPDCNDLVIFTLNRIVTNTDELVLILLNHLKKDADPISRMNIANFLVKIGSVDINIRNALKSAKKKEKNISIKRLLKNVLNKIGDDN